MRVRRSSVLAVQGVAISVAIVASAPSDAAPVTQARFVHAVAGAPPATLVVRGRPPRLSSSYGKPSAYHASSPGPARLVLKVKGQPKAVATKRLQLGRGKYTVIAVPEGKRVELRVYRDDGAVKPGRARVRAIHAAPEIDRADVRVDGRVVAPALRPGAATEYASFEPGRHDLSITRPGGRGGALLSKEDVPLVAGTASSAIVVGSRGMPTQFLFVSDGTAGPATAPATGFVGEVGKDADWLLVIGAALLAGSLGGVAYALTVRRNAGTPLVAASAPASAPGPVKRGVTPVPRAKTAAIPAEAVAVRPAPATVYPQPVAVQPPRPAATFHVGARAPDPALWPGADGAWARLVAVGAAVTAGSLGLLYEAGRRRGG